MEKQFKYSVLVLIIVLSPASKVMSQNETIPGEVTAPYPTLVNLVLEWKIKGDENQNGVVAVHFRKKGSKAWQEAMPLPERETQDLRLRPGSRAIDAGIHIPNINDDFTGKAPDCGAYEVGQTVPHYGPRK
jgi:hypothetical protein